MVYSSPVSKEMLNYKIKFVNIHFLPYTELNFGYNKQYPNNNVTCGFKQSGSSLE